MFILQQSLPASPISGDKTPPLTKHSRHTAPAGQPSRAQSPRGAGPTQELRSPPRGAPLSPPSGSVRGALSFRPPTRARPDTHTAPARTGEGLSGSQRALWPPARRRPAGPQCRGVGPARPSPFRARAPPPPPLPPAGTGPPWSGTWNCSSFSVCSAVSSRSSGAAIFLPPLTRRSVTLRN